MDFANRDSPAPEELIKDCIKKDKRAWDIFIERYSRVVFWAIKRRLSRFGYSFDDGDVEDIHQDVFTLIWSENKLKQVKDANKVAGWLAMVAGNAAIDYFKRVKRQAPPNSISIFEDISSDGEGGGMTLEEILPSEDIAPANRLFLQEIRVIIDSALDSLESKEKMIIKLNLVHGMKHREIAEALDIPVNTVSTSISRTKGELREKLKRKGLENF
ncbi:MAG: sigma-70 family RNA polymerase sigma factor [Candidatus Omnitrophota bacterium]